MGIELIGIIIGYVAVIIGLSYGIVFVTKGESEKLKRFISTFLVLMYGTSWVIFLLGLSSNSFDFNIPIDPVDSGYTPLSNKHLLSFAVFFLLSLRAIYKIWKYGKKQPPLLLVVYLSFLIIGIVLNFTLAIQLLSRSDGEYYINSSGGKAMMLAPIMHVIISMSLLLKVIKEESNKAEERSFKNKFLNQLNTRIGESKLLPVWALGALLPIYLIITLILILFGQEFDSLTKVFTETTTWHLSQETHPPYLDHRGHYLCTVAACGTPKIVKPIRLGVRHGNEIVINRQLLIANAFEDILANKHPKIHLFIRRNYDKYGYPLSKDINTNMKSNITYILMKPLEWMFLTVIYLASESPEKLIKEQYKMDVSKLS